MVVTATRDRIVRAGRFPAGRRPGVLATGLIVLVAGVSVLPLLTVRPPPATSPAEFSVDRAMDHIANIAREPHPMGSASNARVRTYLEQQLNSFGLETQLQSVNVPDYYGEPGATVEAVNVMARIAGENPTKAIALVAHYDSAPATPGANDDGAGVAAMLETARLLLAGSGVRNDVILLFTDGEEPAPRYGSTAFVAGHQWAGEVGMVVNFEAAGGSGPSIVVEMNGPQKWLLDGLAESEVRPVAFSFLVDTIELVGGIGTDFEPFAAENVPGYHLAYLGKGPIYHTMDDSAENVGQGSLEHHGSYAVALTRHFGDMDLAQPPASGELVFFTVGRSWLVRYPVGWAIPLAIAAAVLFAVAAVLRAGREGRRFRSLFAGFWVVLAGLLVAVVVSTVVWSFLVRVRPSPTVGESYAYLFGLLALGFFLGAGLWRLAGRRWTGLDEAGVVLFWVVLAILSSILLRGASYLFVWPALGGAIALIASAAIRSGGWRWVPPVLAAGPALILLVPAIDTFFQLSLPRPGNPDSELVEVISVVMFLAGLVVALVTSIARLDPDRTAV